MTEDKQDSIPSWLIVFLLLAIAILLKDIAAAIRGLQ